MKRKAIIIGSSLSDKNPKHLKGASQDVNNYVEFLTSSIGGGWYPSEIYTLLNPSRFYLQNVISNCAGVDLALVIFTGHGTRNRVDFIQINDHDIIPLSSISVSAKKQIIISDACRSEHPLDYFEGLGGLGLEFDQSNKHVARALYDYFISNLDNGIFNLSSCSPGESSQDTKKGGLFSTTMLEVVHNWSTSQDQVYLTLENGFQQTYQKLSTRQKPAASTSADAMRNFPLAVNPVAYLKSKEGIDMNSNLVENSRPSLAGVLGVVTVAFLAGCLIAAIAK